MEASVQTSHWILSNLKITMTGATTGNCSQVHYEHFSKPYINTTQVDPLLYDGSFSLKKMS